MDAVSGLKDVGNARDFYSRPVVDTGRSQSIAQHVLVDSINPLVLEKLQQSGFAFSSVAVPTRFDTTPIHTSAACIVVDGDDLSALQYKVAEIRKRVFGLQILAIGQHTGGRGVCDVLRSGVADYVHAEDIDRDLVRVIRHSLNRDQQGTPAPMKVRRRLATLTSREREVLQHCLEGTATKVIANKLDVTYQTVDKHRKKSLRKMGVSSLVELSHILADTSMRAVGGESPSGQLS